MVHCCKTILVVIAVFAGIVLIGCAAQGDAQFSVQAAKHSRPSQNVQDTLDHLASRLHYLQEEVSRLVNRLNDMERKHAESKADFTTLALTVQKSEAEMGPLKQGIDKSNRIDQIWRNNFKIVNNVFATLRKKFVISTEAIRFGN